MAKIIYSDGRTEEVRPAKGKKFTLEELQAIVGGYIEIVHTREGNLLVLDEDGKMANKPLNTEATLLYERGARLTKGGYLRIDDYIVGDVLYCKEEEVE